MSDPDLPPDLDDETRERGPVRTDGRTETVHGHPSAIGRRIGARYELLEELGSGGFGTVYRARDEMLDRMVALKIARPRKGDPSTGDRFQREARATARLEHPHAVRIYDAGQDAEGLFLILELVSGESIQNRLRREGPLPAATVANVGRQAASALAAAHALHIVHRDIKPANLLVAADEQVKVADFGVAHLLGEARLTSEGGIVGTPDYMAPEQIEGGEVGPPADLFALGVVLYEMLTGRRPFGKGTTSEVLARIVRADVPPLPTEIREREPELCRTILALLSKKPEARPSAPEVVVALASGERGAAPPPRRIRSRRLLGAAAGLAVIGAIVVMTRERREEQEAASGANEPTGALATPPPLGPPETRTLTLSRLDLGSPPAAGEEDKKLLDLQHILQVAAGTEQLTVKRRPGRQVLVDAPRDRLDHAGTALTLLDTLDDQVFAKPNLFTGRAASTRKVSFDLSGFDIRRFLYVMAAAAGWSVVLDDAVGGPTTMRLEDVPWDVATQTLLDMWGLQASRFEDVWIITTRKRATEIEELDGLGIYCVVPAQITAVKLASLLEGAISPRGIVAANRRLGSTCVVDRWGLLRRYREIVRTVDYDDGDDTPISGHYTGQPVRLRGYGMSLQDFFRLLADLSGLNVVVQPGIGGSMGVWLHDAPWDSALDAILRVQGLRWTLQGNLLTIARPREIEEPVVATIRLAHEDPRFFLAFAKALTPAGTLRVDKTSRALVVRDIAERVELFTGLVGSEDRPTPR